MTRKKRRQLEEQLRLEQARKKKASEQALTAMQQQQIALYSGMPLTAGVPNTCYFPMGGHSHAIQLPPIIQPVAMLPLSATQPPDIDEIDEDEFDDFEEWC